MFTGSEICFVNSSFCKLGCYQCFYTHKVFGKQVILMKSTVDYMIMLNVRGKIWKSNPCQIQVVGNLINPSLWQQFFHILHVRAFDQCSHVFNGDIPCLPQSVYEYEKDQYSLHIVSWSIHYICTTECLSLIY